MSDEARERRDRIYFQGKALDAESRAQHLNRQLTEARAVIAKLREDLTKLTGKRHGVPNPCPSCLQWQDSTRDARRVMRALRHETVAVAFQGAEGWPEWWVGTTGDDERDVTLDDWERENGLPDIDEG